MKINAGGACLEPRNALRLPVLRPAECHRVAALKGSMARGSEPPTAHRQRAHTRLAPGRHRKGSTPAGAQLPAFDAGSGLSGPARPLTPDRMRYRWLSAMAGLDTGFGSLGVALEFKRVRARTILHACPSTPHR